VTEKRQFLKTYPSSFSVGVGCFPLRESNGSIQTRGAILDKGVTNVLLSISIFVVLFSNKAQNY
jgi:hypothetical protein